MEGRVSIWNIFNAGKGEAKSWIIYVWSPQGKMDGKNSKDFNDFLVLKRQEDYTRFPWVANSCANFYYNQLS